MEEKKDRQCGPSELNTSSTAYCSESTKQNNMDAQECGLELKGASEERDRRDRDFLKAAHQTHAMGDDNREHAGHYSVKAFGRT